MITINTTDIQDYNVDSGAIVVNRPAPKGPKSPRLRNYETALTNDDNSNQWAYATAGDADSFIQPALSTIRNRTRYIQRNSPLVNGIISTFAANVVGKGPRLQFIPEIEDKFMAWSEKCDIEGKLGLADDLEMDIKGQVVDGESITILTSDRNSSIPVSLRLQRIATDRLETPWNSMSSPDIRQGVEVDGNGKPVKYHILTSHPGGLYVTAYDSEAVPANQVIHLYQQNSPGQTRGVPWISPSTPIVAQLYRFIKATLAAAETAANYAAVLKNVSDANSADTDYDTFDAVDIERNSMVVLPNGLEMQQFRPEQPGSTFKEFREQIINEIARPLNMPFNVAAGNSAGYNYASTRADHQNYHRYVGNIQDWIGRIKLNRVLQLFIREALLINGYITPDTRRQLAGNAPAPVWLWPAPEHVDPSKEAVAQRTRLENGTTSLSEEWIKQGKDPERQFKMLADEVVKFREAKLTHPFDRQNTNFNEVQEDDQTEIEAEEKTSASEHTDEE